MHWLFGVSGFLVGLLWANYVLSGYYKKVLEKNLEAYRSQYRTSLEIMEKRMRLKKKTQEEL